MAKQHRLACVLVLLVAAGVHCSVEAQETSGALGTKANSEVLTVANSSLGRIDYDKELRLTLMHVKRYRSMATLYFELEVPRNYPLGGFDPHLRLIEGFGGAWLLRGAEVVGWEELPFGKRKAIVSLKVYQIHPSATTLEQLSVRLEAKKRGRGRSYQFAEFYFETLSLEVRKVR